jgi:hypothetical protein
LVDCLAGWAAGAADVGSDNVIATEIADALLRKLALDNGYDEAGI